MPDARRKCPSGAGSTRAGEGKIVSPTIAAQSSASSNNSATPSDPSQEKFVQLPKWIMGRSDLSLKAKLVYAAIVDRIGNNGEAWPGYARIAEDTGLHKDSIKRAVAELIAAGLLHKTERVGQSNIYTLPDLTGGCKLHPVQPAPGAISTQGGCNLHPDPVQRALIENETHELYPMNETHKRSIKSKHPKFSREEIERVYQAYPRKIGKAAALKAIDKALRVLAERGTLGASAWLLDRVQKFAGSPAGQHGRFTPHPATWFNQGRYDDDADEWKKSNGNDRKSGEFPEPLKAARRLG